MGSQIMRPELARLSEHLSTQPNRDDYKLTGWKKALALLAAGLTGASQGAGAGINTGISLHERPYDNAMQSWREGGGGLADLIRLQTPVAGMEQDRNMFDARLGQEDKHFNTKLNTEEGQFNRNLGQRQVEHSDNLSLGQRNADIRDKSVNTDIAQGLQSLALRRKGLQQGDERLKFAQTQYDESADARSAELEGLRARTEATNARTQTTDIAQKLFAAAQNPETAKFIKFNDDGEPVGLLPWNDDNVDNGFWDWGGDMEASDADNYKKLFESLFGSEE